VTRDRPAVAVVRRRGAKQDTPPESAKLRTISAESAGIKTGNPYQNAGRPGGSADVEMSSYVGRGLGRNPGRYFRMSQRNPTINSGTYKLGLAVSALPWWFEGSVGESPEETRAADEVRTTFARIGMTGIVFTIITSCFQYGFALFEKVWRRRESDGVMELERLAYIEPWSVVEWVTDSAGMLTAVELVDMTRGRVTLKRNEVAHFGRWFTGRNWEGQSAYRPLWYGDDEKRKALRNSALGSELIAEGLRIWSVTEPDVGDAQLAEVQQIISDMNTFDDISDLRLPWGIRLDVHHGGERDSQDPILIQYQDSQTARMLDDELGEIGTAQFGSRALATETRRASDRTVQGQTQLICEPFDREIISGEDTVGIYQINGWDVLGYRPPRCSVAGFTDPRLLQRVAEGVAAGILDANDPELRGWYLRALGIGLRRTGALGM